MFKLNRHVDSRLFNGTSGRCASAPYEVILWIDTELNQEDTTGETSEQPVVNPVPYRSLSGYSEVVSSTLVIKFELME
ncbi:hypothetical protein FOTG_07247 [Fusarium oxysporum f. sp. vasinfectum 25433]|uniref:Uncharacterized protein n=1 Tax=Fusarium oxysporum f. sp. vasinfectum 25433 TaxID=1089449 RepID=X0N0T5_FUSOX|nr:hypothetical protein FOTG_07247 [Fusarium oxysporum f. sp. vasinfectum 25433]